MKKIIGVETIFTQKLLENLARMARTKELKITFEVERLNSIFW